jgi:hypothetical protein
MQFRPTASYDMSSPPTSHSSQPSGNVSLPPLKFLHINDPGEAKLPSHRKAVHSHAALYQASQERMKDLRQSRRQQPRKRKRKDRWHGESMVFKVVHAQNFHLKPLEILVPTELAGQILCQSCSPSMQLLGAGRVDPFRTYPVPWDPTIPQLVDHCSCLLAFYPARFSSTSADVDQSRYNQHGYRYARA